MEISACPKCGSRKIYQGKLKEGVLTGITSKYVCKNCGYQGFPILFDSEKEYKKFKGQFNDKNVENKEVKREEPKEDESFIKNNLTAKLGLGLIIIGLLLSAGTRGIYLEFTLLLIIDGIALILVGFFSPKEISITKIKKYPKIAGYIMIISGIILFLIYCLLLFFLLNLENLPIEIRELYVGIESYLIYVCALQIIFSIIEIIGGIFAIKRQKWGIALIGAILGSLGLLPFYISTIIGIIALVLLSFSKDLFANKEKKTI